MSILTRGDLKTELKTRLNQNLGPLPLLVSEAEAESWIRQAYIIICRELPILVANESFSFGSAWAEYPLKGTLASEPIGIDFITVNEKGPPLDSSDQKTIMSENPNDWNTRSGIPSKFYITDWLFSSIGFNSVPGTGNTFRVYYMRRPPELTADTGAAGTLLTPEEYNIAIVEYMYYYARLKRKDADVLKLESLGQPAPAFWNMIEKSKRMLTSPDQRASRMRRKGEEMNIYTT
ncbi:MAG: hypothetical protein PHY56_00025 [Candidatus Omnitrophica bacterium]|nr:hypothetical protein [Candidatus Omnitrophota bacterium]